MYQFTNISKRLTMLPRKLMALLLQGIFMDKKKSFLIVLLSFGMMNLSNAQTIPGEPGGICVSSDKPDLKCTPGIARQILQSEVCSTTWGLDNRHITEQMKREIA